MDEQDKSPRTISVPGLIAWLSVCLLAAAWGRTLDEHWQELWARAGAFGLTAAVGLGGLEQARRLRKKRLREQLTCLHFNDRLAELSEQNEVIESIHVAIRRLSRYAASQRQTGSAAPLRDDDPLLLAGFPLQIVPVEENNEALKVGRARSIPGVLRKISSIVISFEHKRAFAERVALLTFQLGNHEQLCFVVDVRWTQKAVADFVSSGAVLAVGVPAQPELESAPAETVGSV